MRRVALQEPIVDAQRIAKLIDELLGQLRNHYVFPEIAVRVDEDIRKRLSNGEYDGVHSPTALCETLTLHMQEVSHDKHLRLFHSVEPRPEHDERDGRFGPDQREEYRIRGVLNNFGFRRVEHLAGNVGYLDLREFYGPEFAAETAISAMNFLSETDALILDLRHNGGGSPAMVALMCSYFFDVEPVHLSDIYWRENDRVQQFWTLPYVPGKRYIDKPIYILTSSFTFSGAEEFAYNLKNLNRATVVGEVTRGGAHPTGMYWVGSNFCAKIPTGRSINPITRTNWEGTGVIPDVKVPQELALKTAQRAALKEFVAGLDKGVNGPRKALREEAESALRELEDS